MVTKGAVHRDLTGISLWSPVPVFPTFGRKLFLTKSSSGFRPLKGALAALLPSLLTGDERTAWPPYLFAEQHWAAATSPVGSAMLPGPAQPGMPTPWLTGSLGLQEDTEAAQLGSLPNLLSLRGSSLFQQGR